MDETPKRKLKVLVVDDIVASAKLLALIMGNMFKADVVYAYSATLALEQAVAHQPDLMMVDINMPTMNGYKFLEEIRAMAAFKTVPMVAVSANALPEDVRRGFNAGFDAYITKPYEFDDIWTTVCPLIGWDINQRQQA